MKKIFVLLLCLTLVTPAQALSSIKFRPHQCETCTAYNVGYQTGRHDARSHTAKTVFFVGTAVIAGVIIYQLGKESRWTAHDGQVGYRF